MQKYMEKYVEINPKPTPKSMPKIVAKKEPISESTDLPVSSDLSTAPRDETSEIPTTLHIAQVVQLADSLQLTLAAGLRAG